MTQKKNRIFATLHADGTMQSAPSIHFAINKFRAFKNASVKNRVDAVVELDANDNIMRYIISNIEYGSEMCPHCDGESAMHAEFRAQHCTECGRVILPCHLCVYDYVRCTECPLKGNNRKYIGGIKPNFDEEI